MAKLRPITVQDVEQIAIALAKRTMTWNEPIPNFATRYPNILESCLVVPFQSFERKLFYKGLTKKAAALFYLMIKNHPFHNGNKRLALTTTLMFLFFNKKWLQCDTQRLYAFAKWVAESDPAVSEQTIAAVETVFRKNIVPLEDEVHVRI